MEEVCPKPTIQIPRSLFIEYGEERDVHKNWKTLIIKDHIIELNHILGIGCQGTVYDADSNIYGKVAVKEVVGNLDGNIADIAASIGVGPELYEVYKDGRRTYLIFEKLDNMLSYMDMCNQNISYQVCECITKLIENGIFHNDIRSANIMVTNGKVNIIDYDSSTLAFDSGGPYITAKKYDELLKRNYMIYIDEKQYTIAFPYEMQERLNRARENFSNLLVKNFILGIGWD